MEQVKPEILGMVSREHRMTVIMTAPVECPDCHTMTCFYNIVAGRSYCYRCAPDRSST
jgi:ribosomal protein S27E